MTMQKARPLHGVLLLYGSHERTLNYEKGAHYQGERRDRAFFLVK
jgi:hypothetical protein